MERMSFLKRDSLKGTLFLVLLILQFLFLLATSPPSNADVINTSNTSEVLNAIGVPQGTTATYSGDNSAIGYSTSPLANFPPGSDIKFGILSTGRVTDIPTANTSGSQGTDLGPWGTAGDKATLSFTVPVPKNAGAIGFNTTFLSEEYPEYVGSIYNDKFRALLNGKNVALDIYGKPIEVNNNFFNPSLTPKGTFFDGQTSPLAIRAALPSGSQGGNVNLTFSVEDVGDGIYDSAVFLNDLKFFFPQTLYLQFGQAQAEIPVIGTPTYNKPDAGLSSSQISTIVNDVQSIYDDFLINVTSAKPTSGDFTTINVGGTRDDLPLLARIFFPQGILGKASEIDLGNDNLNDDAVVFSGENYFSPGGSLSTDRLSQTIAHEAGHLLGLFHVEPSTELMYPLADGTAPTGISKNEVNRAERNLLTGNVVALKDFFWNNITQNSYQELVRNIGLETTSLVIGEPSLLDKVLKFVKVFFGSLFSTIYNAKIGVIMADDAFPSIFDIGDIVSGQELTLKLPAENQFAFLLYGSSIQGGAIDVFSSAGSLLGTSIDDLDYYAMSQSMLLSDINLALFKWQEGIGFSDFGSVKLNVMNETQPVPEPATIGLLGTGLIMLYRLRRLGKQCSRKLHKDA